MEQKKREMASVRRKEQGERGQGSGETSVLYWCRAHFAMEGGLERTTLISGRLARISFRNSWIPFPESRVSRINPKMFSSPSPLSLASPFFNFLQESADHQRMASNTSGCARSKGELWTLSLSRRVENAPAAMGSRWRFVLYNPLSLCGSPGYSTWPTNVGPCGALRHTLEISRESRVPHRAAEGRLLGTSLWKEKRTLHEIFCRVHDDLLPANKEEGPLLHCAGASHNAGRGGMVRLRSGRYRRDCWHCGASWFLNKQRAQNRWESSGRHTGTWETALNNTCTVGTGS